MRTVARDRAAQRPGGQAAYGWCKSHSRYFWGFRLYVLCAPDGMPICFELAAANVAERVVAAEMLYRIDLRGYTVMADKGFASAEFEAHMAAFGARFLRPDRKDEEVSRRAMLTSLRSPATPAAVVSRSDPVTGRVAART